MVKPKTRVGAKFKTAIGGKSHNKSEDLEKLRIRYDAFSMNLKEFVAALKQHHAAMEAMTKTRLKVRRLSTKTAQKRILFSPNKTCNGQIANSWFPCLLTIGCKSDCSLDKKFSSIRA
jgi:hypothetical protein